jgi:hypothetical protein
MNNSDRPILARLGLIAQTTRWRPTPRAWLAVALLLSAAALGTVRLIYPFLAVTDRADTKILVVEGWIPDYTRVDPVMDEIRRGGYELIVVTGGPTPKRELVAEFSNYADLTKAILEKKGVDPNIIVAVPSVDVARDRTYASALALKQWLGTRQPSIRAVNLLTLGAHGRRSRLLFEEALGDGVKVGIISTGELRFDGGRWWKTSSGVREVLGETIAYAYARIVFDP